MCFLVIERDKVVVTGQEKVSNIKVKILLTSCNESMKRGAKDVVIIHNEYYKVVGWLLGVHVGRVAPGALEFGVISNLVSQ